MFNLQLNRKVLRSLENLKAFNANINYLGLIDLCQLFPTSDWKVWKDCMGYGARITNKQIIISKRAFEKIIDPHFLAPIKYISQKSKYCGVFFSDNNSAIISFITKYDKIKILSISNMKWDDRKPPLYYGLEPNIYMMRAFTKYNDGEQINNLKKIKLYNIDKYYLLEWPPNKKLKQEISSYSDLGKKIIKDCEV